MYLEELLIIIIIAVAVVMYRNYQGQNVGKYITSQVQVIYDKFAPYSFKMVRDKTKELGQEYKLRQYPKMAKFIENKIDNDNFIVYILLYIYQKGRQGRQPRQKCGKMDTNSPKISGFYPFNT